MKKFTFIVSFWCCCFLIVVSPAVWADTQSPSKTSSPVMKTVLPPDIQRILTRGTLIVALYNEDTPPFVMTDAAGNLSGFDIDMARNIAQQLGVKVVFNRDAETYDDVVRVLNAGKADMGLSELSQTLPRALQVGFTQPYLLTSQTLLVNRLWTARLHWDTPAETVNGLTQKGQGLKIGVVAKSAYLTYAKQDFPQVTFVRYENFDPAMRDAAQGKIFAVLDDEISTKYWLSCHQDMALYLRMMVLNHPDQIAIAVPWQDIYFLNWLKIYIHNMQNDGTEQQLANKYFNFAGE